MVVARSRRIALSFVVALLCAFLIGPVMPPVARASYYEDGVSMSGRMVRGSVTYRLNVKVIEAMGFVHQLEVSISKRKDPAGPTSLRQKQTWIFDLEEDDLSQDGSTYYVDAGSEEGPFHMNFVVAPGDGRCGRNQKLFVSRPEGGAFRIETGNERFGTITELPSCGSAWSFGSGAQPGPPRCPVPGRELRSAALDVRERNKDDAARIGIYAYRERDVGGQEVEWSATLTGTLPAGRFALNRDLKGHLRSGGAPWLGGRARFEPGGPLKRGEWYPCKGGREARSLERRGAITGNLTFEVIGHVPERIVDPRAWALRSWVRPRR